MATIRDIAELAGVSRATVDRVLNDRGKVKPEKEERIRKVAKLLGYQPNLVGKQLAARKKKLKIGFCYARGQRSLIFPEILRGVAQKAKELEEYGVAVELYPLENGQVLEPDNPMLTSFDCDGLAVSANAGIGVELLIRKAKDRKIPVVFYNVDAPHFDRLCYVGCDYLQSGRLAAGLTALCSNGSCKVGIFTVKGSILVSYEERIKGFRQEIEEKYPHIDILGYYIMDDNGFEQYETVRKAVEKHPDMDIVYLVNPGDYSMCHAVTRLKPGIRIITNDVLDEQRELVKSGVIAATIAQEPRKQGALPLEILFNYLALGIEPRQEIYYTKLEIYIGQNV